MAQTQISPTGKGLHLSQPHHTTAISRSPDFLFKMALPM